MCSSIRAAGLNRLSGRRAHQPLGVTPSGTGFVLTLQTDAAVEGLMGGAGGGGVLLLSASGATPWEKESMNH